MVDVLTKEQRRKCMSNIRSKNTKPEILVRKYLFSQGIRFRVNVKKLPGTPDIQSPNQKIPDRKTKCVIETHLNIKQNVIFGANLKPV
ncbi:hypothetical protein AAH076_10115 [Bacteroides xylanisolvens]|uniref:hypothetical protein n=1 Tax=Bacteroides xylanisolvens TaxID=371601 RepID=UPI0039B5AB6A